MKIFRISKEDNIYFLDTTSGIISYKQGEDFVMINDTALYLTDIEFTAELYKSLQLYGLDDPLASEILRNIMLVGYIVNERTVIDIYNCNDELLYSIVINSNEGVRYKDKYNCFKKGEIIKCYIRYKLSQYYQHSEKIYLPVIYFEEIVLYDIKGIMFDYKIQIDTPLSLNGIVENGIFQDIELIKF